MAFQSTLARPQASFDRCTFGRASRNLRPRLSVARRPSNGRTLMVRAGLGQYLGEAAAAIFSPTSSDVPWEGGSFSGEITHHNEVAKLRRLHSMVKSTRQQLAGCTDPKASNYNPDARVEDGTCEYIIQEPGQKEFKGGIGDYISAALSSVMGSNFQHDEKDKKQADFKNTLFSYSGQTVSQRDITRLLHFERVVKKTLDDAESRIDEA